MMHLDISACCDCGLTREKNEDMALVGAALVRDDVLDTTCSLSSDGKYILAVCDGVGGHSAGEVASQDAANELARFFARLPSGLSRDALKQELEEWHTSEHLRLVRLSQESDGCAGMGTTLVTMFFYEGAVFWGNCGDSRLYRYRDGILVQLSTDHSLYKVTRRPEDMHIITNSLGGGEGTPSYLDMRDITSQVLDGDIFLLCSDGLFDRVPDDEIEHMLCGGADAPMLVMAACEFGTQDNVTAIVIKVEKK